MTSIPSISNLSLHQFTVDEYHRMADLCLFDGQKVELLYGQIVDISPIISKHAGIVKVLNNYLRMLLDKTYIISVQDPIKIGDYSEPEPDIAILKFREDYYALSHPTPIETFLIIEVAESSLEKDQKIKLPLYAEAKIPELWIVNIPEQQLEQYFLPKENEYTQKKIFKKGEMLKHDWIGELEIDLLFTS